MKTTALPRPSAALNLPAMARRRPPVDPDFLAALRRHGQVIEADTEDTPLPEGVTHVLVKGRLIEKRKSAF